MNPTSKLTELYYQNMKVNNPQFPEAYIPKPKYKLTEANGLTRAIIDYIRFTGNMAERINVMGRKIKAKSGKEIWIPSAGKKGSADIHSTIKVDIGGQQVGVSVMWEVKIGKDRQSQDQIEYQKKITNAGGFYFIVRDFDDFHEKYTTVTKNNWHECKTY